MPRLPHRGNLPASATRGLPADGTAKDAGDRRNWYLAYTRWRIGHLRHESVTYFRDSPHRSLIWFMVMRGYYDGTPPSLQDCIAASLCSIGTARAIITTAEAKRYFRFVSDPSDSRKRRIAPTALCVAEYQEMVGIFLRLADLLDHRDLDSMIRHVSAVLHAPHADATKWYRAYAQWRVASHRAAPKRKSVRFFRQSRPHTTIWMAVMEGHYADRPAALNECIRNVMCSKDTARKIVNAAIHAGYFILEGAPDDSRKKLVRPSAHCVEDYQAMVDMLLRLADVLQPRIG
ncbi:MAG: hypothetical protein ACK4NA_13105 [Alphaproteobacteria bacterium]